MEGLKKKGHVLDDAPDVGVVRTISSKPLPPNTEPDAHYGIEAVADGRMPGAVNGF